MGDHLTLRRALKRQRTGGGLVLPAGAIKREANPCWGEVLSVGDDVHGIERGMIVFFNEAETNTLELPDGEIVVMRAMCIVGTLDKDTAKKFGLLST